MYSMSHAWNMLITFELWSFTQIIEIYRSIFWFLHTCKTHTATMSHYAWWIPLNQSSFVSVGIFHQHHISLSTKFVVCFIAIFYYWKLIWTEILITFHAIFSGNFVFCVSSVHSLFIFTVGIHIDKKKRNTAFLHKIQYFINCVYR